jgi:hypothetical protein
VWLTEPHIDKAHSTITHVLLTLHSFHFLIIARCCVRVCVCVRVCACVHVCVRACVIAVSEMVGVVENSSILASSLKT